MTAQCMNRSGQAQQENTGKLVNLRGHGKRRQTVLNREEVVRILPIRFLLLFRVGSFMVQRFWTPTLIIFKDGKVVDRFVGVHPKAVLQHALDRVAA